MLENKEKPKYYLKSLGDVISILESVGDNKIPVGIADISKNTSIGKSKVHRLVNNLCYWGLLSQDIHSKKYFLGSKILEIARSKLISMDLIKIASNDLDSLLKECHETVHLACLDNGYVLYLDKKQGPQAIGIISAVGQRLHAHCSGLGKVLLAHLDKDILDKIINNLGLPRFTENTITDKNSLIKELQKVKNNGFAIDNEEIEKGLCCVAAPVRNYKGDVIAAISVSIPVFRFDDDKKNNIIKNVILHANDVSTKLGYNLNK